MADVVQTVALEAPVERTYNAIIDSAEHSTFTGARAQLSDRPGTPFTTHGGAIEGWVLDVVPNERIVQAWRPADWPAGVYSVVRYDFEENRNGTKLTLTHTGLPADGADHIAEGWEQRYWGPLAAHLEANPSA